MKTVEKFPYDVDFGAIMDYVDGRFMLVIKDESWSDEEIALLQKGSKLHFCYTMDIAIFIFEGGDIDSSDFYFNVQDCDAKESLLKQEIVDVELILVNAKNEVCFKKRKTLTKEQSAKILECLHHQNTVAFRTDEFDVNVQGLQDAYEPFELEKYAVCSLAFQEERI